MRKLNYMMADFKLRVDHITYDATKKLDALKEGLRPVKPIPPSPYIDPRILRSQRQALMLLPSDAWRLGQTNNINGFNQGLNMNLFDPMNQVGGNPFFDPTKDHGGMFM